MIFADLVGLPLLLWFICVGRFRWCHGKTACFDLQEYDLFMVLLLSALQWFYIMVVLCAAPFGKYVNVRSVWCLVLLAWFWFRAVFPRCVLKTCSGSVFLRSFQRHPVAVLKGLGVLKDFRAAGCSQRTLWMYSLYNVFIGNCTNGTRSCMFSNVFRKH